MTGFEIAKHENSRPPRFTESQNFIQIICFCAQMDNITKNAEDNPFKPCGRFYKIRTRRKENYEENR